jgi:hypothetical protein
MSELSPRKASLHLEMLVCTMAARRLVKSRGIEPTLRQLARRPSGPLRRGSRQVTPIAGGDAMRAARRVHRILGRGTCLEESAALAAVLSRHGAEPELVVGCRRQPDGSWGAHAWVVSGGAAFDLVPSGAHTALSRYRLASGWRAEALTEG